MTVFEDNKSDCVAISEKSCDKLELEALDVPHPFLRELLVKGHAAMVHVLSECPDADMLTGLTVDRYDVRLLQPLRSSLRHVSQDLVHLLST